MVGTTEFIIKELGLNDEEAKALREVLDKPREPQSIKLYLGREGLKAFDEAFKLNK